MKQHLLTDLIGTLEQTLKNLHRQVGSRSGFTRLTVAQLQYIDAINQLAAPTITEIAARLSITCASVTAGVNKLVSLGYAVKTPSSEDRRALHVGLTAAGRRMVAARDRALEEYGALVDAALTAEEARQFEAIVAKLVRRFRQQ